MIQSGLLITSLMTGRIKSFLLCLCISVDTLELRVVSLCSNDEHK
jgi:hypothetical protein